MPAAELERRLTEAFPDAEITITDLAGDGDHYKARIVSPAFAGLPRVRQHQLVNKALADVLGTPPKDAMRYRPFGATYGMAVSTVSLLLDDSNRKSARDWCELIEAAMGAGINAFELAGHSDTLLDGLSQAMGQIERRLLFLAWQAPAIGNLDHTTGMILRRLGTDYLDLVVVEDLGQLEFARTLKHSRQARQIGVWGSGETMDLALDRPGVDCLITPYSLTSGWKERHRLKVASERNIAVIARDVCPAELTGADKPGLIPKGWFKKKPKISARSPYAFLEQTHGWTGEEICLAFALFEPAVTSVQVQADGPERIVRLATVPERDLPTGVAAQIEMARFSGDQKNCLPRRLDQAALRS
eukprot:gene17171-16993_t